MAVKLNGNTSGYVVIDAPAVAGVSNLTLPVGNGSILSDHDNTYNLAAKGGFSNVWTTNTPIGFAVKQGLVAYAPTSGNTGIFFAKPINTNTSYYSLNGTTWNAGPTIANAAGTTLANANILVYLPNPTLNSPGGKFVLGVGNTTLYYVNFSSATNSAANWSTSFAPANVVHMAYGAGKLVALTANVTTSFYSVSEDANTWSPQIGAASSGTNPKYMQYFPDLAGGRFMSYQRTYGFGTSQDGYTWDTLSYSGGNITIGSNSLFYATPLNSPVSYNGNTNGTPTYLAVTNNYIASSADCITWNIVNAAATLGVGNTAWYSLGAYGGYSLFTSGSTGAIYGITNNASTITTIYAAPGINAISGPGFVSTPYNYTIFDNSTAGNNISTFSYGTTIINPQQRGYMDNIIIGESIPTKGRFNELIATELTIAYHSPNNAVGGYNLISLGGSNITIQAGGSGSTTVMSPGSFYLGIPGGANAAMQGNGFFIGSSTTNAYLYSSGLYLNQNNINGTNGLFSTTQTYMNPDNFSNTSGGGGFWLGPSTGMFLGNTATSFQITLSANAGAYLYLGSYTQSTTGTGGAIVNTSMYFFGNNTINAYMTANYSAGNLALVMQNTTTNAYLTPNTLFIGNDSINTTVNTVSIYINPTLAANTTGTGGLSISPINGIFFGNNTTNATMNTSGTFIGGVAPALSNLSATYAFTNAITVTGGLAATTGSGAFTTNGNIITIGNTTSNSRITPTSISPGGTLGYTTNLNMNNLFISNGAGGYNVNVGLTGTYPYLLLTGPVGNAIMNNAGFGISAIPGSGPGTSITTSAFQYGIDNTTTSYAYLGGLSLPTLQIGGAANVLQINVWNSNVGLTIGGNTSQYGLAANQTGIRIMVNPYAGTDTGAIGRFQANYFSIGNTTSGGVVDGINGIIRMYTANGGFNFYGNTVYIGDVTAGNTTGTGAYYATTTGTFIGNNTINTSITTTSLTINPTASANTTGTGGLYVTGSNFFMGNNTINTTHTTTSLSFGTGASSLTLGTGVANTTGTGGLYATGTSGIYVGNTLANALFNSTSAQIGTGTATTTGTGGAVVNSTAHFVGNNTANATMNTAGIYIGGKVTAAATGYTVLPNGIKMNWGSISANSLGVVGTFASAFTTLYNVVIGSTSAAVHVGATASNATTVTATTNSTATTTVYYHAIGV
jgi:hypothetical protein